MHERTPQWHGPKMGGEEPEGDDNDRAHSHTEGNKGAGGKGNRNTLTSLNSYDSNSSDEDDDEDEDLLKEFEREAMDAVSTIPDFYNPNVPAPELDELTEERKGNPFIKMLSVLRGEKDHSCMYLVNSYTFFVIGRIFSSDAALQSEKRSQPSRSFPNGKQPAAGPPRPGPAEHRPAALTTSLLTSPEPKKKQTLKPKPKLAPRRVSIGYAIHAMPFGDSTATLTAGPTVAQSPHKCVQEEGITEKTKHKSPTTFGDLTSIQESKKGFFAKLVGVLFAMLKGFFIKLGRGFLANLKKDKAKEAKGDRNSFFNTLTKKTKCHMHQLPDTAEDDKKGFAPLEDFSQGEVNTFSLSPAS